MKTIKLIAGADHRRARSPTTVLSLLAAALVLASSMLGYALMTAPNSTAAPADNLFIAALDSEGIYYSSPGAAIAAGRGIAAELTASPDLSTLSYLAEALVVVNAQPGQYHYTYSEAGTIIYYSVHYYAPGWVEEWLVAQIDAELSDLPSPSEIA